MSENRKNLEVVSGNGSDLDFSPVYEHISAAKPKCTDKNKKNIVIPKVKKSTDNKKKNK